MLKEQAANASVSNGDYVEMLIRERAGMPPLRLPAAAKQTGPKGGAKSFFFGKNRGTTTAVCVTPMAHRLLDEQVAASRMSRGDYIEYLLREKGGVIDEMITSAGDESESAETEAAPATCQSSFAPPEPVEEPAQQAHEVVYAQPVTAATNDWTTNS